MTDFETLLQRYLDQKASHEERKQLFALIRTGQYDARISRELYEDLETALDDPASDEERTRLDHLYHSRIRKSLAAYDGQPVEKTGPVRPVHRWWTAAAAASVALLGLWWWLPGPGGQDRSLLPEAPATQKELASTGSVARFTDKQLVYLPDGSTVLLNDGSELTYNPMEFGVKTREVILEGEGFFDIHSDAAKPFHVRTGKVRTTVLGTAFNVRFIPGSSEVRVTVARGKVQVGDDKRTYDLLSPDQEIVVNTNTYNFAKKDVNAGTAAAWKDKFLILDNITMGEALQQLEARFKVKLIPRNKALNDCHISASFFNEEDLDHVLMVIGTVNGITYTTGPDGTIFLDSQGDCR